jgi:hypothetical protein
VKDIFAVIPSDTLPTELIPNLRGASVDLERLRWFEVESVREDIAGSGRGAAPG